MKLAKGFANFDKVRLDNAPLRGTRRDLPLFVDRDTERAQVLQNLEMGWNTLVLGGPGIGKTSLLNHLAAELEDSAPWRVVVQPRGRPETVHEALAILSGALVEAVGGTAATASAIEAARRVAQGGYAGRTTSEAAAVIETLGILRDLIGDLPSRPVIILDELDGALLHRALFGRLRDELWSLGAVWVVAGAADRRKLLLQAPADAFFESVITLGPLAMDASIAFIKARLWEAPFTLDQDETTRLAALGEGHPVRLLGLLRAAASGTPVQALERQREAFHDALAGVSPPARRLARAVIARGEPGRTTDEELQHDLGWSAGRLRQLFHELVKAGAFDVLDAAAPEGRPGRPSKAYVPREGAQE